MSSGEMVPDVITTLLNRSNMGLIAMEGSKQLSRQDELGSLTQKKSLREMEDGIWHSCIFGFEWFQNKEEALVL